MALNERRVGTEVAGDLLRSSSSRRKRKGRRKEARMNNFKNFNGLIAFSSYELFRDLI